MMFDKVGVRTRSARTAAGQKPPRSCFGAVLAMSCSARPRAAPPGASTLGVKKGSRQPITSEGGGRPAPVACQGGAWVARDSSARSPAKSSSGHLTHHRPLRHKDNCKTRSTMSKSELHPAAMEVQVQHITKRSKLQVARAA